MSLLTNAQKKKIAAIVRSGSTVNAAALEVGVDISTVLAAADFDAAFANAIASAPEPTPIAPGAPTEPPAIDWRATIDEPDPFARLMWLDGQLVAGGFPEMSPWWRYDLSLFLASGKRWGVYLVGRGGGKSTTLTRLSVADGLFTPRTVPPGQRWIFPFVSVGTSDSRRRITEIAAILRALGIDAESKHVQGQPTIETEDAKGNAVAFVAIAGTISAVSGPSAIGAIIDEEAKLRDRDSNANPARELIASIVQTFRARSGIRAIRCSSAWDEESSHAASIREGDTEHNHVGRIGEPFLEAARAGFFDVARWEEQHGGSAAASSIRSYASSLDASSPRIPTWIANPTIGAVASRLEVEALPSSAVDGLSRYAYWMRENGSVTPGSDSGGGEGGGGVGGVGGGGGSEDRSPYDGWRGRGGYRP